MQGRSSFSATPIGACRGVQRPRAAHRGAGRGTQARAPAIGPADLPGELGASLAVKSPADAQVDRPRLAATGSSYRSKTESTSRCASSSARAGNQGVRQLRRRRLARTHLLGGRGALRQRLDGRRSDRLGTCCASCPARRRRRHPRLSLGQGVRRALRDRGLDLSIADALAEPDTAACSCGSPARSSPLRRSIEPFDSFDAAISTARSTGSSGSAGAPPRRTRHLPRPDGAQAQDREGDARRHRGAARATLG